MTPPDQSSERAYPGRVTDRSRSPVLAQRTDRQASQRGPAASSSSVAAERAPPGPGRRGAVGVVEQHRAAGRERRETVRMIDSGVARRDQSPPQADHSTVCRPARRAAYRPSPVITPYGGRYQCDRPPVRSSMTSRLRRQLVRRGGRGAASPGSRAPSRARRARGRPPPSPAPAPAHDHVRAEQEEGGRDPVLGEQVQEPRRRHRSGPSSNVSATCRRCAGPASRGRDARRRSGATG